MTPDVKLVGWLTVGVAGNPMNPKVLLMIGLVLLELVDNYDDWIGHIRVGGQLMIDFWPNLVGCLSQVGFYPNLLGCQLSFSFTSVVKMSTIYGRKRDP